MEISNSGPNLVSDRKLITVVYSRNLGCALADFYGHFSSRDLHMYNTPACYLPVWQHSYSSRQRPKTPNCPWGRIQVRVRLFHTAARVRVRVRARFFCTTTRVRVRVRVRARLFHTATRVRVRVRARLFHTATRVHDYTRCNKATVGSRATHNAVTVGHGSLMMLGHGGS